MKKYFLSLLFALTLAGIAKAATVTCHIEDSDIHRGFYSKKIWLNNALLPRITLSGMTFVADVTLPSDAVISVAEKFEAVIGIERKKPFVVVRIPVFSQIAGSINRLTNFDICYEEQNAGANMLQKTTAISSSVLASGTWYKIAISKTGFYKIDGAFINSMGLDPAKTNPAHLRIYGNGGIMLSEDNSVTRPHDLLELAIQINHNGNTSWDNNESAIFYATGTTGWYLDNTSRFRHIKNLYTDTAYYFITFDLGPGSRVAMQEAVPVANVEVNAFNYYDVHEQDLENPATQGKIWYGEQFTSLSSSLTQNFTFDIGAPSSCINATVSFGSTAATGGSGVSVSVSNSAVVTNSFMIPTSLENLMNLTTLEAQGGCGSSTASVSVTFSPSDNTAIGYLDYIEINTRRDLVVNTTQMGFRDIETIGAGKIASYKVQGAGSDTRVWDVTDRQKPVLMDGALSGNTYTFSREADMLHEFAVMSSMDLFIPKFVGITANQDLHGMDGTDMLIVTHRSFLDQANTLAGFHRQHDGMKVYVVTTDQVYNEFSSGGQDLSAIRDFVKLLYDRADTDKEKMPKYLLLFGNGSYDYKNRVANNCNYVPVFESANSVSDIMCFSSDDFYGFLDDNEYIEDNTRLNVLDIGIGRLPARSTADAEDLVSKVIAYASNSSLGQWRINTTIVADDGCNDPAGNFLVEEESMVQAVTSVTANLYNHGKVYGDAIPKVSTPAGARSPNANVTINNQVNKGTFWINYIGHGNPTVWAGERILTQDDYMRWNNQYKLPFMVTGTCDFGQFDHPQFVSAGEKVVLRRNGGVIINLTTTKAVYSTYNNMLNAEFLDALFRKQSLSTDRWHTFSDAVSIGKNATYITSQSASEIANFRKFVLLGDPAVTPAFPQFDIAIDSIIDAYTSEPTTTVKALGEYRVIGSVRGSSKDILDNFNGTLNVSFFDKPRSVPGITGCGLKFNTQDNIIYKGKVKVMAGTFSFSFVTPKDINYSFGKGKISTYAQNGTVDAAGVDTSAQVGGYSDNPVLNDEPPVVRAYINDTFFINGGITGKNTSLYVAFSSKTGINVSGSSVGHDLTAVLDSNVMEPYLLNDYYETEENTYQRGYASFPLTDLPSGRHTLRVKAFDVNNNMGVGTVEFTVLGEHVMVLEQVSNYPNPFAEYTHFVFEHNHPEEKLKIQIAIYTTDGNIVRNIVEYLDSPGSRTSEITWDGRDNVGSALPTGMYIYRMTAETESGIATSAFNKLVITR